MGLNRVNSSVENIRSLLAVQEDLTQTQTLAIETIKCNCFWVSAKWSSFETNLWNRRHQQGAVTRGCCRVSKGDPSVKEGRDKRLDLSFFYLHKPALCKQFIISSAPNLLTLYPVVLKYCKVAQDCGICCLLIKQPQRESNLPQLGPITHLPCGHESLNSK